jgi:hypothetical protein
MGHVQESSTIGIVSHIDFDIWLKDGFSRIRCWSFRRFGQQNCQSPGLVWICETLRSRLMNSFFVSDIITYYRYVFDVMYAHIFASAYTHTVYRYSCILTYIYIYVHMICFVYQYISISASSAKLLALILSRKLKSRRRSKDLCLRDLSGWMPFWWETRLQMLSVLENGKTVNLSGPWPGRNGPLNFTWIFVGGVCPISWQVGVLLLAIDWNVFLFFEHADTWFRNQVLQGLL